MAPSAIDTTDEYDFHNLSSKADEKASVAQYPWLDPVPFGGDDVWYYIPETKRFDLSRGSPHKLVVDADDGVHHHRGVMIDPENTVLVVIDMQNYFLHPVCRDHPGGLRAVEPTLKVIERCRKEGIQVAWLNWGITEHDLNIMPPAVQRGFSRNLIQGRGFGWHVGLGAELPEGQGRCLFKGSWSADIYPPLKAAISPRDIFCDKNRPSGMWSPDEPLHRYLRDSGKKTLLFAGVNTDQCVLGTITDSYSWGFDCILLADCAATTTSFMASELCEYNIATNYGFVTTSKDFLEAHRTFDPERASL